MISYWLELLDKPKYMLSYGEQLFLDAFPFVALLVIVFIIWIIVSIIEFFRKKRKRRKR